MAQSDQDKPQNQDGIDQTAAADKSGNQSAPAGAKPQRENTAKPAATAPLTVLAQYVKDLSFENPKSPQIMFAGNVTPKADVRISVDARQMEVNRFEVVLKMTTEAKLPDGQTVFLAEISYGGVAQLAENTPKEHIAPLLHIEMPRLLFPFAREIMASSIRQGGFPAMLVQPFDFVALFKKRLESVQAQQQAQQASGASPTVQ